MVCSLLRTSQRFVILNRKEIKKYTVCKFRNEGAFALTTLHLSIGEPFTSPAWGSNFVVFSGSETISESFTREYIKKACKYAEHYSVYLVPQRFMLMDCQCMCLISPKGRVIGAQKGIYINTQAKIGQRSSEIAVFTTEFGGIFLCVDVDIYYPEVAQIAHTMGAQYIVCSQFVAETDNSSSMVFSGAWNAAQTARLFVIDTGNRFHCVCAPLTLTKHRDGFVVSPGLHMPTTASLQADDLRLCALRPHLSRQFYHFHRTDLMR